MEHGGDTRCIRVVRKFLKESVYRFWSAHSKFDYQNYFEITFNFMLSYFVKPEGITFAMTSFSSTGRF